MAISQYWKCWWHTVQMYFTKHKWVTLGSSTHNLIQHSTHDTNHVHRVQSLPFTLLPMVDPLSVSSTCCPSLETGSLRWMRMVGHAFTGQFGVVASQWWGTSWTSVDLTSAWELQWVVEWYTTLCVYTNVWCLWDMMPVIVKTWQNKPFTCTYVRKYVYTCHSTHTHVHTYAYTKDSTTSVVHVNLSWQYQIWQCSVCCIQSVYQLSPSNV